MSLAGWTWAALMAFLGAAAVMVGLGSDPGSSGGKTGDALAEQGDVAVREGRRCTHCGWIESKREVAPGAADPAAAQIYEYTVRMGDGSSSVFREQLPVTWRVRERLIFIDGEKN